MSSTNRHAQELREQTATQHSKTAMQDSATEIVVEKILV